jgi:hypothetical protein
MSPLDQELTSPKLHRRVGTQFSTHLILSPLGMCSYLPNIVGSLPQEEIQLTHVSVLNF